jgi:hypothetical protein
LSDKQQPRRLQLDPGRRAWERQPGESGDHYAKFKVYLELGDYRSLEQVVELWNATSPAKKHVTYGTIKQYSSRYRWTERVADYDAEVWAAERKRLIQLRKDAMERHRKAAMAMQGKAAQALAALPVNALGPGDVVRMLSEGVKLELGALGEPQERVAHHGAAGGPVEVVNAADWTPEQRKRYMMDLLTEMGHRTGSGPGGTAEDDDDQVIE